MSGSMENVGHKSSWTDTRHDVSNLLYIKVVVNRILAGEKIISDLRIT